MELEALCQQATFILNCDQLVLKWQLEQKFERYWGEILGSQRPQALKPFVLFDLLHAMLRNHHWWQNPLFRSSLKHFLVERYGLGARECDELVERLVLDFGQFFPMPHEVLAYFADERNFVDYFLIKALTARSKEAGVLELGLGEYLFQQVYQCSEPNIKKADQVVFLNDLEKMLREKIAEISEMKVKIPWAFDIYRLQFFLVRDFLELGLKVHLYSYEVVFQCLLYIGQMGTLGADDVRSVLANLRAFSTKRYDEELLCERLLKALTLSAIIDEDFSRGGRSSSRTYRLTGFGYELTQNAYAAQKKEANLNFDDFLQLPYPWQAALLRQPVYAREGILEHVLKRKVLLHPHVALAIAESGLKEKQKAELCKIIKLGVLTASTLEFRKAYCQLATKLLEQEEAFSLLRPIVASDAVGTKMRESAALSLYKALL